MATRGVIAWDFDDVCVDFVGAYLNWLRKDHHVFLRRDEIKLVGWDMGQHMNEILAPIYERPFKDIDWLDAFPLHAWEAADTTPGVVRTMEVLFSEGWINEIVTNKPPRARSVVWSWLAKTDAPVTRVEINGHFKKHDVSKADILVDDRPATIREWNASRDDRLGILYARSQNSADREGLVVATGMRDVYYLVEHYGRENLFEEVFK